MDERKEEVLKAKGRFTVELTLRVHQHDRA